MRKLAWYAGSFSAGIFLAQYLLPEALLLPAGFVCLLLGIGLFFLPELYQKRLLLILLGLSVAFGYDWLYVRQVQRPAEALVGTTQQVTMTIFDAPITHKDGAKVSVRVKGLPGKVMYYGRNDLLSLHPGQVIQGTVAFSSASHIQDEDVNVFTSKGVFLLAYQRGDFILEQDLSGNLCWLPARLGGIMRDRINLLFSGDERGLVLAMLTGDRTELSGKAKTDLSESGLYHILAVSGMHCVYLLALLRLLLGRYSRYAAFPVLVCYAILTGGSPSVIRACVMLLILTAAQLAYRDHDAPTALSVALLLILLKNPFAAQSISLQMSFGAVIGLLWITPKAQNLLFRSNKHGKVFHFIAFSISASIGCLAFTIPLSAFYFGSVVTISVLSNLLCLWSIGALFVSALSAVVLAFVCLPLGMIAAYPASLLAKLILWLSHKLARLPYHAVNFTNPYLIVWLVFLYVLFILLWLFRAATRKNCILAAALSVAMLIVTVRLGAARFRAPLDVVVLDAGQGQCVLMKSQNQSIVVDCGSMNSWYGPGDTAADWLLSMGCHSLDMLVVTHFDSDHVNGIEQLMNRISVKQVLIPEENQSFATMASSHGTEIHMIENEQFLRFGSAELNVYPPLSDGKDNERGLSLLAKAGEDEILITGDMSGSTEKKLLETYSLPDIEALVVGHHGSKNSTSAELLETVKPEIACISVGKNSYGHPTEETLRRLNAQNCVIYRTDLQGSIHLTLGCG